MSSRPHNNSSFDSLKKLLDEDNGKEMSVIYEWKWKCLTLNVLVAPNHYITFHPVYSAGTAVIRGDTAFAKNCHYFWEFRLCSNIYGTDIMIGVGTRRVSLSEQNYSFCSLLGMDDESYGYSYHGFIQHKNKKCNYGPKFNQGALVGVYLDMFTGTLEFYFNKVPLGIAFRNLKNRELYPMVSSTAANSVMKLTNAHVHQETLQLKCMRAIAKSPVLMKRMNNVPGLKDLLAKRYMWLSSDVCNNNNNVANICADKAHRFRNETNLNAYCTAA